MTTREIVTIQVGHFANFVGAHWWNLQVSLTGTMFDAVHQNEYLAIELLKWRKRQSLFLLWLVSLKFKFKLVDLLRRWGIPQNH